MLRMFRSHPSRPVDPDVVEVAHAGESYRILIKRMERARRLTLRVRAATLDAVLTMPKGGSLRAAQRFAARHAEWIGDRLQRLPQKIPLHAGSTIPLRGAEVPIVRRQGLRGAWVESARAPDGSVLTTLCVTGEPEQHPRRILDLLRREAKRDLDAAVRRHSAVVGRPVKSITLRDTRSRWGSCTALGSLNFSWRLILAPPHVLDYLAAHEVAHLVHMDHSPAYWAVARRLAPDLAAAEAWLKLNGALLHRYG